MASFIESFLGGAAEGLNEQFDMKRKEERANRMLTKELELKRDFGIENERRLEEKKAKENIKALGAYYNPANVDRIVAGGSTTVTDALARAKELQAIGKVPDNFINSNYLKDTSLGNVKYVGDKGWNGHVRSMINGTQNLSKVTRKKGTPPVKQSLFKPISQELLSSKTAFTDMDEAFVMFSTEKAMSIGTDNEQKAKENFEKFLPIYKAHQKNNPEALDLSPVNQTTIYENERDASFESYGIKGEMVGEGVDATYQYIFEGNEGKYFIAQYDGIISNMNIAKEGGFKANSIRANNDLSKMRARSTNFVMQEFNSNVVKNQIIDQGEGERFQHGTEEEIAKRINKGAIPEGAVISYVRAENPAQIIRQIYGKSFNILNPTLNNGLIIENKFTNTYN